MERASSQHSPRVDEQLAHETESLTEGQPVQSRSRDDLQQEASPEHVSNRPGDPGGGNGLDEDEIDLRARLAASIRPAAFPADRQRLLAVAFAEQAPEEVVRLLERLPAGVVWDHVEAVWEAAGGRTEPRPS